jgi:hypothetical protein
METPEPSGPEIAEWLESDEGEAWSRNLHYHPAAFRMPEVGIAQIKPLYDPGAGTRMDMRKDTVWWHAGWPQELIEIKVTTTPPECI